MKSSYKYVVETTSTHRIILEMSSEEFIELRAFVTAIHNPQQNYHSPIFRVAYQVACGSQPS